MITRIVRSAGLSLVMLAAAPVLGHAQAAGFSTFDAKACLCDETTGRSGDTAGRSVAAQPTVVLNGYRASGYDVIAFRGMYYGFAQSEGFDLDKIERHRTAKRVFVGKSLQDVTSQLDAHCLMALKSCD
jgi:hypothetical protein